jgi:hypothetical protein
MHPRLAKRHSGLLASTASLSALVLGLAFAACNSDTAVGKKDAGGSVISGTGGGGPIGTATGGTGGSGGTGGTGGSGGSGGGKLDASAGGGGKRDASAGGGSKLDAGGKKDGGGAKDGPSASAWPGCEQPVMTGHLPAEFCPVYMAVCGFGGMNHWKDMMECMTGFKGGSSDGDGCKAGHLCRAATVMESAAMKEMDCQTSAHSACRN